MAKVEHKESPMKTVFSLSSSTLSFSSLRLCLFAALSLGGPCAPLCLLSEQTEMRVEEWGTHQVPQREEDESVKNKRKSNTRHEGNSWDSFLSEHIYFHRDLYHSNALKESHRTIHRIISSEINNSCFRSDAHFPGCFK